MQFAEATCMHCWWACISIFVKSAASFVKSTLSTVVDMHASRPHVLPAHDGELAPSKPRQTRADVPALRPASCVLPRQDATCSVCERRMHLVPAASEDFACRCSECLYMLQLVCEWKAQRDGWDSVAALTI